MNARMHEGMKASLVGLTRKDISIFRRADFFLLFFNLSMCRGSGLMAKCMGAVRMCSPIRTGLFVCVCVCDSYET